MSPLDEVTAARTSLPAFALREVQGLLPLILPLTISCMCLVLAHGASDIITSRALCLVAVAGFTIIGGVVRRDELEALTVATVRSIDCLLFNQLLAIYLHVIRRHMSLDVFGGYLFMAAFGGEVQCGRER